MKRCCFVLLAGGWLVVGLPAADAQGPALEPINLTVNTAKDEDDPHVSSSNLVLFYAANAGKRWEIKMSVRKSVRASWPAGQPYPNIKSKEADFRGAFLTADGKIPQRFYYSSDMDPLSKGAKGDNHDIYFHVKFTANANFGSYNALVTVGTERDESYPWLTPDERQLYVSRLTEGGWRQFVSTRQRDGGQFPEAVQVRLPLGYHHATLTPDGRTMYLQGPLPARGGRRRWGLFVSTSTGKDTWSRPAALTRLNADKASTGDYSPNLSRDGTLLYFASDRPGGKGGSDIWVIPTAQLKR